MLRLATVLALAGLGLATFLVVHAGIGIVASALAAAGFGILWASLFHIVPMALNARGWQAVASGADRPSILFFTWLVWVREAVNALLPVARVGGEVVAARLMIRRGMRPTAAVGCLVVDTTLGIVVQFVLTLVALAALLTRGATHTTDQIAWSLVAAVPMIAAMAAVQRFGLFGLLGRLARALAGDRWAGVLGSAARFDRAIRIGYRRPGRVLRCLAWQAAGIASGAGEVMLALYFLGHPVPLTDALLVEVLIQAVSSAAFVVPGALGVQEGAFLVLGGLIGLPADIALALALVRRARDLVMFIPAVVA